MSCYDCLSKFSFFTKEHSCSNCALSFCSKCLKQKAIVRNEEKNVCKNCYKMLTTTSEPSSAPDIDTPALLLKRLETLENPAKPPITIFRHSNRLTDLKYGLSSEDKKILERLEKLKADHTVATLPDEKEIKRRLALLQEKSEESIMAKSQVAITSPKSQQEEVDDLLKQFIDEAGIDANLETRGNQNIKDIEDRLQQLKMTEATGMPVDTSYKDSEDGDTVTARIIKRAIAEGQLEKRLEESMEKNDDSDISDVCISEAEEELPWCIICNENATIRCLGCDGSLYCKTCFSQGHEFFNMGDHKFVPLSKKNSLTEAEE